MFRLRQSTLTAFVLMATITSLLAQGSLTPPSAPAPTMRTLDEIDESIQSLEAWIDITTLPVTNYSYIISEPGKYALMTNLIQNPFSIDIVSSNVWLDLNGHLMQSPSGGGFGIDIATNMSNVTILNGTLHQYERAINGRKASYIMLNNLTVLDSTGYGIMTGPNSTIRNCRVEKSTITGFDISSNSTVTGCTAMNNPYGFYCDSNVQLTDCHASYNQIGFDIDFNASISGCSSTSNTLYGIRASSENHIINSCVIGNGNKGVIAGDNNRIEGCLVNQNANNGIDVDNENLIIDCSVTENKGTYGILGAYRVSIQNSLIANNIGGGSESYGVSLGAGSQIIDSLVGANKSTNATPTNVQGAGIKGSAITIKNCTIQYNDGDGIIVSAECDIRNNQVRGNGYSSGDGAGIRVTGTGNSISDNVLQSNDRGLEVEAADNLIVRNHARNNDTNWVIAAGNAILVEAVTTAGAFTGNSGGTAPAGTNPNANLTF